MAMHCWWGGSGMGTMWGCGWNFHSLHIMTASERPRPAQNAAGLLEEGFLPLREACARGELIWIASHRPVRGALVSCSKTRSALLVGSSGRSAVPSCGPQFGSWSLTRFRFCLWAMQCERGCRAAHLLRSAQSPSSPCPPPPPHVLHLSARSLVPKYPHPCAEGSRELRGSEPSRLLK